MSDLWDLAQNVLTVAKARGIMITSAESCTGGMIGAALTDHAGSSACFEGGFICYSNGAKTAMLDVKAALIARHGAVSEPVAAAMAQGALANSAAHIAIATTGIAGPGASQHKPEGRVCFALAHNTSLQVQTVEFGPLGRAQVRLAATRHALSLLLERLGTS